MDMNAAVIRQLLEQVESLSAELKIARELLKRTWYLPMEGGTVAVYRIITGEDNEAIVQYLTLIDAERFVPKEKRK
jgi:hypothetical protein